MGTTINLCKNKFSKFLIITPVVKIDRNCDGQVRQLDQEIQPELLNSNNKDENNNNNHKIYSPTWNKWCSLFCTAVRCFGVSPSTPNASSSTLVTAKLIHHRHHMRRNQRWPPPDMNGNGFYVCKHETGKDVAYQL